jgi:hypothetical protein
MAAKPSTSEAEQFLNKLFQEHDRTEEEKKLLAVVRESMAQTKPVVVRKRKREDEESKSSKRRQCDSGFKDFTLICSYRDEVTEIPISRDILLTTCPGTWEQWFDQGKRYCTVMEDPSIVQNIVDHMYRRIHHMNSKQTSVERLCKRLRLCARWNYAVGIIDCVRALELRPALTIPEIELIPMEVLVNYPRSCERIAQKHGQSTMDRADRRKYRRSGMNLFYQDLFNYYKLAAINAHKRRC